MSIMKQHSGCGCHHTSGGGLGMSMAVNDIRWVGINRNYEELKHKPSINGRVLVGHMSLNDIGALTREQIVELINNVNRETGVSYITVEDIENQITEHNYVTPEQVDEQVTSYGYVNGDDVLEIVEQYIDQHPDDKMYPIIRSYLESAEGRAVIDSMTVTENEYEARQVGNVRWHDLPHGDLPEDGKIELDEMYVVGEDSAIEPLNDNMTNSDIDDMIAGLDPVPEP